MNLYFIINPAAKNGFSLKIWKKLEFLLEKRNIHYHSFFTEKQGDGKEIAKEIVERSPSLVYIVAVGGDGTIHEVVNGVHPRKNGIIGYIPAGSGNDFSRGFLLPRKPEEALEYILKWMEKSNIAADMGRFQGNGVGKGVFINNFGIGLDAKIAKGVNQSRMKPLLNKLGLGKLTYVYYLLKELFFHHPMKVTLQVDDQILYFEKTFFVTVSNHPFIGGGMKLSPESLPYDGQLEAVIVNNVSKLKILFLFITVFMGTHVRLKEVTVLKGKHIHIKTDVPNVCHADGEYAGAGDVDIRLLPHSIHILANNTFYKYPLQDKKVYPENESMIRAEVQR